MNNVHTEMRRIFLVGGLSVIGAFAGTGVASVLAGVVANSMARPRGVELMAASGPLLLVGGVLGLSGGFMLAVFLFKQRPEATQAEVESAFIGNGGVMGLYSGLPMFFVTLLVIVGGKAYERLAHRVGEGTAPYLVLLLILFVYGAALYCSDRIPRSLIMPIGILGWLLTFSFACWWGWFGRGAFGYP